MFNNFFVSYLVNISFYLALKAKKETLKGHPIVDVLYKHKEVTGILIMGFLSPRDRSLLQCTTTN